MQRKQRVSTPSESEGPVANAPGSDTTEVQMYRSSLALLILCFMCALAHGQTFARVDRANAELANEGTADQVLATRGLLLLKRLDDDVIVYRSLGEFEESGKLARVSLAEFKSHLQEASREIESISSSLSDGKLKNEMRNALASYRDGAFWWQQVYQPRVVNVSSLTPETNRTPSEAFLLANTPYTVAIYWRQAHKYFQRAVRQAAGLSQ
ncbi:MAG TPA: hypothetical protein VJT71_08730 [Pyrinomonadaceae bacterium]|nr:hypothetical protein [Pyrinomonadaceae bacterium]